MFFFFKVLKTRHIVSGSSSADGDDDGSIYHLHHIKTNNNASFLLSILSRLLGSVEQTSDVIYLADSSVYACMAAYNLFYGFFVDRCCLVFYPVLFSRWSECTKLDITGHF